MTYKGILYHLRKVDCGQYSMIRIVLYNKSEIILTSEELYRWKQEAINAAHDYIDGIITSRLCNELQN